MRSFYACALLAALSTAPAAQTPLTTETVVTGLQNPVVVTAPRGDDRLFIVEQHTALIRVADASGNLLPTPFLDVGDENVSHGGEQGLLGLAFHPDYESNGFFFIYYTDVDGHSNLVRYTVSAGDPDVADPNSATEILFVEQVSQFHHAGDLKFGPFDGYLYVSLGDGGGADGFSCSSQDPTSLKGKVLRIDVDQGLPYTIPPSNPFVGFPAFRDEIWSYGFRNPWRMSFDRVTGDLFIGDVGNGWREEINFQRSGQGGSNFGWPIMEADICHGTETCSGSVPNCFAPTLKAPIHHYTHVGFWGPCATIGGVTYQGCAIPDLRGTFFFGDHCFGKIWSFRFEDGTVSDYAYRTIELTQEGDYLTAISTFGEDGRGEVLFASFNGNIYRIVAAEPPVGWVDCDSNGLDDPCEIAEQVVVDLDDSGGLDVCQDLSADAAELSLTAGGVQNLDLHAGAEHANRSYAVWGSISGTSPGLPLSGFVIPLSFDSYTSLTITAPNTPPLVNSFASLDTSGEGAAQFVLPAGALPGDLAGVNVFHAYLVLNEFFDLVDVSNFVRVRLVP